MIVELGLEHRGAWMRISAASHVPECHYATRRDNATMLQEEMTKACP